MKWYEKSVFYHIYPLGLLNAEKENNIEKTNHRLRLLEDWIPHIKGLSCTAIYIGPLFESASHGYDTSDFTLIDKRLGDNDDFRSFVTKCHEADIKVVVDGVFNHTGRNFFAFRDIQEKQADSNYREWYKGINFNNKSARGDDFSYDCWQGYDSLPALNLENPQVKAYLLQVVSDWIKYFDIDGIRLDCANVLDFQFMKELRQTCDSIKVDFWLMGEVIHGDYSNFTRPDMLHSVTNYELHKGLYSGHNDYNYFEIAHTIRRQFHRDSGLYRNLLLYNFVDNHDESRIASKLNNKNQLHNIYTLLYTLPGIPALYYGSEWGLEGMRTNYSDIELRPALTLSDIPVPEKPLTSHIKHLGTLKKNHDELSNGFYKELHLTNRQYIFKRYNTNESIIIGVNMDDNPYNINLELSDSEKAIDLVGTKEYRITDGNLPITIPPCSEIIIKLEEKNG